MRTVKASQELGHDTSLHFSLGGVALGRDGIYFVDKDDTRRHVAGVGKELSDALLRLARHSRDDLGCGYLEERNIELAGNGMGQSGLAASGRPVQQDATENNIGFLRCIQKTLSFFYRGGSTPRWT